jgi:hypothetical protein
MARTRSIQDLRNELQKKERQLDKLLKQREKIVGQLDDIDAQIQKLGGEGLATPGRRGSMASMRGRKRGVRARRATGRPLGEYVKQVLAESKEPMRVKDIVVAVQDAGYRSSSKDFYGIVAAALRETEGVKRVGRGQYTLAG